VELDEDGCCKESGILILCINFSTVAGLLFTTSSGTPEAKRIFCHFTGNPL
jgi:hypothetical protein